MKKLILATTVLFLNLNLQAKTVCTNENLTYIEDVKSFGIPRIPVGTPMGLKTLIFRGQTLAHKDFFVTDANDWTNYQDWDYSLSLQNENVVWVNPHNNYERVFTANFKITDNNGVEVVSNEQVSCLVNELVMPLSDF